jgi:hypothetical protein
MGSIALLHPLFSLRRCNRHDVGFKNWKLDLKLLFLFLRWQKYKLVHTTIALMSQSRSVISCAPQEEFRNLGSLAVFRYLFLNGKVVRTFSFKESVKGSTPQDSFRGR